jgi:acyl carrier protein
MTSLEPPSSALKEGFLASKIRARIAEHLGADIERINDDSRLSEDFGLDLLDIIELMVVLEEEFAAEREITDEANQIELVVGLIRHIERQSIESHRETLE